MTVVVVATSCSGLPFSLFSIFDIYEAAKKALASAFCTN